MPALPAPRKNLILAICCMSLLIVGMDNTIVNVALPSIRTDLGANVADLQWIIDAYTVTLASLLVLSGSTADRFGRRRIFIIGLSLFSVGSLLCSVAPNLALLVAFRMLQAIGGSMLNPVAMSIITNVFTERRERPRPSVCGAEWSESAWASVRWWAGSSPTASVGGRSSGSTCRSG